MIPKIFSLIKNVYRNVFGTYNLSNLLSQEIENECSILDVGCGRTSALMKIRKGSFRIGIDIYKPYIEEIKGFSVHDGYCLCDVRELPFKSKSFDCAIATEILEHLEKQEAFKMLQEIERVTRKKILMTTPNCFLATYPGPYDNPDETHLSGWFYDELKNMGFKVYGFHGLKYLWTIKAGQAVPRFPKKLFAMLIDMSSSFAYKYPCKAF